jgi:putative cardiolipin synthase
LIAPSFSQAEMAEEPFLKTDFNPTKMQILDHGSASLVKRIQLIRGAQKSIELESFIFNTDTSGKIIAQELVKKSHEGVNVRILVDASAVVFRLNPFYAQEFQKNKIEVRYYNTAYSLSKKAILYRNHRKLLVVDDLYAIVGGRNIADEYFDLSERYNFLDRDLLVEGIIVKTMRLSFDQFWNSPMVSRPDFKITERPKLKKEAKDHKADTQNEMLYDSWKHNIFLAKNFLKADSQTTQLTQNLIDLTKPILQNSPLRTCNHTVFASDRPGVSHERILLEQIEKTLRATQSSLIADSPYLILQKYGLNIISDLLKKGVDLSILTNSLHSTDAFYTIPLFIDSVIQPIREGAKIYIYTGELVDSYPTVLKNHDEIRWGVHAKTAVIDHKHIMVGSFNADPRSSYLNSELDVFCFDSPELAHDLEENIQRRLKKAVQLDQNAQPIDGRGIFFGTSQVKRLMYFISNPVTPFIENLL